MECCTLYNSNSYPPNSNKSKFYIEPVPIIKYLVNYIAVNIFGGNIDRIQHMENNNGLEMAKKPQYLDYSPC